MQNVQPKHTQKMHCDFIKYEDCGTDDNYSSIYWLGRQDNLNKKKLTWDS